MCRSERDTADGIDLQQVILEELHNIREDLVRIGNRISKVEERVEQVVRDLHIVHSFQQGYSERLSIIEKMCVDLPLQSTPIPRRVVRGDIND
jgi:archaellum component FlaC